MAELAFGPSVAFGVLNMHEAAAFYENVMGFKVVLKTDDWIQLKAGVINLFLVEDSVRVPTFELVASDVSTVTEYLEHHGCMIDEGMTEDAGQPVVRDPYGYLWVVSKMR